MTGGLFFFSSRRRHTRYWRDWSSDVCSSDLIEPVQDDSTEWVSGLVVAPKPKHPSEVRVCGDYRDRKSVV